MTSPALGQSSREALLATARDGNQAAIQSIATMECRYERVPWGNTTLEQARKYFFLPAGQFWRSGNTYRLIDPIDDGTTREYVVRNDRGLWLRRGGPLAQQPILTSNPPRPVDGVGGEMWQYLLFSHWGWLPHPLASYYPFSDIVQHPHVLNIAERLPSGEIHVELSNGGVKRQEFWFDPKANYLVRKVVCVPGGNAARRREEEVVQFSEPAPAVFVPTTIEHRCFHNGRLEAVIRTLITELKVNHRMPASALRIPGIAGMDCIDVIRDVKYKVDADGNRIGPETPVKVVHISPKDGDSGPPPAFIPQPSQPPTPWWVWVLIASACVLAAAFGLAVARRRRAARA